MNKPDVHAFHDEATFTITYVVSDPATGGAAIVDPVLDYDPASGRTSTASADEVIAFVNARELDVLWILETHVHADHLTGAPYLQEKLGGKTAIGDNVSTVQETFKGIFNLKDLSTDGSQFDHRFIDGDSFTIGEIEARVIATPGHTPACITYVIGDAAFVGDTLFMPDFGTARTDFPGGSAPQLYASIQKILALPDETRLFMCHDYKAPGRDDYAWETTVGERGLNRSDGRTIIDTGGKAVPLATGTARTFNKISDFKIKFWFHHIQRHSLKPGALLLDILFLH